MPAPHPRPDPSYVDAARLVRAAQSGDRAAFGEIYRRHARAVHGILVARLPPEDADDLVQEVFVRAMATIGSLRDPARLAAWLSALARNAAHDLRRTPRVRRIHQPLPETLRSAERADDSAWTILAAIRSLPRAYRDTLALRLVEGMTGPEIARATGLTPDSVRVNLSRGMKLLRARLEGGER